MSRVRDDKGNPAIPLNSNTLLSWLADFEEGELFNDDVITLVQYMIDENLIWIAPEWMQRAAIWLINAGYCIDGNDEIETVCMCLLPPPEQQKE